MSTEKKPKPPRPPAPNLAAKKSIKKQASSGLSFSFNDLKAVDSDEEDKSFARFTKPERDDPLSDPTKIKEMKPLTNTNHDLKTKEMKPLTHSNNGATSGEFQPLQKEDKDSSFEDIFDAVNRLPSSKPIAVLKPVTEQVKKVQEEVKRTRSSPPRSSGNTENRESDGIKSKPKLQKGGSGILRVATEVLEEKENESYQLPSDSQEALADPLSFLDKVMEDQLENSFDDDDNGLEKGGHVRKRRQSGNGKKKVLQQQQLRTKSLDADIDQSSSKVEHEDSMDINPCYFNVPTPAELKDEPIRRPDSIPNSRSGPKSQAKGISLSGLLASPDITEEDNEKPSTNVNSEGFRTPDMPPDDTDWVTIEKKPQAGTSSPPPSSNQLLSPEEENKTIKATPQGPFPSLPFYTLYTLTFLTFLYFMFPLPTYITGFLTGLLCSFYLVLCLIWMNLPPSDKSFKETEGAGGGPPLVIPGPRLTASKIRSKEQEKVTLKGWMNELTTPYDPETYNVNQTHSIYVRLEGHSLRLSKPKQNIARRSMFDEPTPRPEFIHQRIYDIRGSHVYLQPEGLVKKRLWSKKYPLFIELPKKGISVEKKDVSPPDNDETAAGLGFDVIKKDECDDKVLVLFARTGREKEEWFWKFEAASLATKVRPIQTLHKKVFLIGNDIIGEDGNPMYRVDPDDMTSRKSMVDFYKFLAKVMPKEKDVKELIVQDVKAKAGGVTYASPGRRPGKTGSEREMSSIPGAISNDAPVAWVNAFIGRFFWDFLREQQWADLIQTKLQKKLSKLKIPHFMEALTITGTDLGLNAPTIRKASKPTVDSRGMWVDLEMHYGGSCWMTLSTKFNLWKLGKDTRMEREMEDLMSGKKEGIEKLESTTMYCSKTGSAAISNKKHTLDNPGYPPPTSTVRSNRRQMSAALDSEEEDSAESSDDEVAEETNSTTSSNDAGLAEDGTRSSSKILRFVNKVANSNYFQRATQNKYVKRAFNEVSNTAVELTVEVKELRGVLTVNIPPPPSDRVWYGFRGKPHLWLSAKPKLGTRQVTITHITEYIEKKLEKEFQRVFVLPNMDDIPMPIMNFDVEEHRFAR